MKPTDLFGSYHLIKVLCLIVQREDAVLPAGRRSLRPRAGITSKDYTSEEEEEEGEEEEEARPLPIPAYYLRGPPIRPRSQQV